MICLECSMSIPDTARKCPYCRSTSEPMRGVSPPKTNIEEFWFNVQISVGAAIFPAFLTFIFGAISANFVEFENKFGLPAYVIGPVVGLVCAGLFAAMVSIKLLENKNLYTDEGGWQGFTSLFGGLIICFVLSIYVMRSLVI